MNYQIQKEKIITREGICLLGFLFFIVLIIELLSKINLDILNAIFHAKFANYNYYNPPIFLSIGEAVAAVAIITSVFQFKKDVWEIALEVRKNTIPLLFCFIIAGLLFVIISSIIPLTFSRPSNILQISLFWQLLGGISILIAPFFLFYKTRGKNLFNHYTKKRFISVLLRRVSSRSSKNMDLVADILKQNLDYVFELTTSRPEREDIVKYANSILAEVISDPIFARHIVTSRADFFQFFLHKIKRFGCYGNHSVSLVFNSFIKASFENKNSYLYSELEYAGMGVFKPFLNDIFYDQQVFLKLRPFENLNFEYGERVDKDKLELFMEAFKLAIKGYWYNSDHIPEYAYQYSHFKKTFEKLKNVFSIIIGESHSINDKKQEWDFFDKITDITMFLGNFFIYDYKDALKGKKVQEKDLKVEVERKTFGLYPASLTADYVKSTFNCLCEISRLKDKDQVRDEAITLSYEILMCDDVDLVEMKKLLLELIWQQIDQNLKGLYPLILPSYLSMVGMWQGTSNKARKEEYNRVVELLNAKIKPLILSNKKMADDALMEERILPPEIIFNRSKDLFEWKMRRSSQEMIIRK